MIALSYLKNRWFEVVADCSRTFMSPAAVAPPLPQQSESRSTGSPQNFAGPLFPPWNLTPSLSSAVKLNLAPKLPIVYSNTFIQIAIALLKWFGFGEGIQSEIALLSFSFVNVWVWVKDHLLTCGGSLYHLIFL